MKKLYVALFLLTLFLAAVMPGNAEDFPRSGPNHPVYADVRSDDPYYLLHLIHYQLYRQPHTPPVVVIIVPGWHNEGVLQPQLKFPPKAERTRTGR